ncbi:hypothetical protein LIER_24372 [Lithospermum erythrorhizon]|uniref:Uncharacterized protein n=1 Tax=Lithospermum erythrorhizon TaxID=34254 RepID=A0AAV3R0X8_LITER
MFNKPNEASKDEKLDELIQAFQQYATTTTSSIRNLAFQMGQLAEAQQKKESGRFPSPPEQAKSIMTFMHEGSEEVEKFGEFYTSKQKSS